MCDKQNVRMGGYNFKALSHYNGGVLDMGALLKGCFVQGGGVGHYFWLVLVSCIHLL